MLYQLYNLVISSNNSLRGLPVTPENEPSLNVEFSSLIGNFQALSDRFMQWSLPGGEPWLSCAKTDSGYLLRFSELADFTIDKTGSEIVCMSRSGISEDTIQHLEMVENKFPGIFVRGFKAPGWQINDEVYRALKDKGYWVMNQYIDYKIHYLLIWWREYFYC